MIEHSRQYGLWVALLLFFYASLLLGAVISGTPAIQYLAAALPFLLLTFYLSVFHTFLFSALILLALPLSINLKNIEGGFGISLPGEILIFTLTGLILLNLIRGRYFNRQIIFHPVTIAILINMGWMLITTLNSTMPFVSLKFIFIRGTFILVFYLFFQQVFGNKKGIQQATALFAASLSLVILFVLARHARFGFIQQINFYVPQPFFNDHTIYGATIAMIIPFFVVSSGLPDRERLLPGFSSWIMLPFLLGAVFFSYSRAVWLSLVLLIPLGLFLALKIKFRYLLTGLLIFSALLISFRGPLLEKMGGVESERGNDVKEHAESIANINTSVSNKERINRWEAALAMFPEKPLWGFGPGTYPFQYAPYQKEESLTRISTYFGDKGGVHSEYLKPLTESGLPGLLSFLAIILLTVQTAFRLIYKGKDRSTRLLATALLLGLTTYYIHGLVNFFLDTDKTSALFWGMTGFLVALDIRNRNSQNKSVA